MTSGGTESILLAVKTCRDEARARGVDTDGAELVIPLSAHPAFDKAAHYLGLAHRAGAGRGRISAPTSPRWPRRITPAHADAGRLGALLPVRRDRPDRGALGRSRSSASVWLHVDACVGGYFAPFARMNGVPRPALRLRAARRAQHVGRSPQVRLRREGRRRPSSTAARRSGSTRSSRFDDWPAGGMLTPTVAGTRPGGAIASAWAVMNYLGVEGYREKARQVSRHAGQADARDRRDGRACAPTAIRSSASSPTAPTSLDAFAVWGGMMQRGWFTRPHHRAARPST